MGFEARPVVIDVHVPGGVAGLRGLSAANLAPAALGRGWMDAGIWSRHAITRAVARNRGHRVGGLGAALERLTAETGGPGVPYPSTDLGVDLVAEASRSSASVIAPFPLGAVECFRTKSRLGELAAEAGVRVPPGLRAPAAELRTGRIAAVTPCAVKSDRPVGTLRSTR